jgi:hypothetical protein
MFNTNCFATVTVVTRTRLITTFSLCIVSFLYVFFVSSGCLFPFLLPYIFVFLTFISIFSLFQTKAVGQEETELPSIIILPFRVYMGFLVSFCGMNRRLYPLHRA